MAEAVEESVNGIEEAAGVAEEVTTEAATEIDGVVEEMAVEVETEGEAEATAEDAAEDPMPEVEPEPELPRLEPIAFRGLQKNPSIGITVFLAGIMAFSMGVTHTFFAEATAWTFVIWGLLLLFSNLLDNYQTYELDNRGISITNPVRFWYPSKQWEWSDIYRLDVLVGRRDTKPEHADMHIYHELSGEIIKDREDRKLDPTMAQIIIDRAGLQPVADSNPAPVAAMKLSEKNKYHWSASGSLA